MKKNKKLGNLDTYEASQELTENDIENIIAQHNNVEKNSIPKEENKKGLFQKIWEKTIFPEMIQRKKEEKEFLNKIKHEAKLEAMSEMKGDLKEQIKKQQLDKLSGKGKSNWLAKIGDNLAKAGENVGSSDRIGSMMGMGNTGQNNQRSGPDILGMIGVQQNKQQPEIRYVEVPVSNKKKKGKKKVVRKVQQQPQNNINNFEEKIKNFMK